MKVTILAVGKVKENYLREGIEEYRKRLSKFCETEIIEVGDEKTPDQAPQALVDQILKKEGERLLKVLQGYDRRTTYITALAIEGKMISSETFSEKISDAMLHGKNHFVFVIGGSLGLYPQVLKSADELLSFSAFTFPHQLMRLIFLEQFYRAMKIRSGEPYHK